MAILTPGRANDVTVDTGPGGGNIPPMTAVYPDRPDPPSDKSRGVTLALATVLGPFGGHRFYVGKSGTGALMAVTLGGLGLWWIYDLILVASGSFRDAQGRVVRRWDPEAALAGDIVPADVLDELDLLRRQVAELSERVDFAERMLAAPRPQHDPSRPGIQP